MGNKDKGQKFISWSGAAQNFIGSKSLEGSCMAKRITWEIFGFTINVP